MLTRPLISCADRPGIVAAVSRFLHEAGANITSSDQHTTDPKSGAFFMRMEFHLPMDDRARGHMEARFERTVARPFAMDWRIWDAASLKRVAILVSRYDHCLLDLLWRHRRGELEADIGLVASNHPDLQPDVEAFGFATSTSPSRRAASPRPRSGWSS